MAELVGNVYGRWVVLAPTKDKSRYVDCQCLECGKFKAIEKYSLVYGKSKMCVSCARSHANRIIREDLVGKTFGRLTVTGWKIDTNNHTVYLCDCVCGNTTTASYAQLVLNKQKQSCGCLRSDLSRERIEKTYKPLQEEQERARIHGTLAYTLGAKTSKNSQTGVTGVSKMKNGKYRSYINLARKQYYLGCFDTLEEAIQARKAGEEKYFRPVLEEYEGKK